MAALPRRRYAAAVRIDLTSPWPGDSCFRAPMPASASPSQSVQKVMSGARRPVRSRTWRLSGGAVGASVVRCSRRRARTAGCSRGGLADLPEHAYGRDF